MASGSAGEGEEPRAGVMFFLSLPALLLLGSDRTRNLMLIGAENRE